MMPNFSGNSDTRRLSSGPRPTAAAQAGRHTTPPVLNRRWTGGGLQQIELVASRVQTLDPGLQQIELVASRVQTLTKLWQGGGSPDGPQTTMMRGGLRAGLERRMSVQLARALGGFTT